MATKRISRTRAGWSPLWVTLIALLMLLAGACGGSATDEASHGADDAGLAGGDAELPDAGLLDADAQPQEADSDASGPGDWAPAFSIPGGTYHGPQEVGISVTKPGATIHYTVDGSQPTEGSPVYTEPIVLAPVSTTTVKAFATAPGLLVSATNAATYEVLDLPRAAAPTFDPPGGVYSVPQPITISSTTPGAVIHYTLDGNEPTSSSPVYVSPIGFDLTATTIKAFATAPGYEDSTITAATYTCQCSVAMPVFSLPSGTYSGTQTVAITVSTPNARIFYTTDGSGPTVTSTEYFAPLSISTTTVLRAFAVAQGLPDSAVAEATYVVQTAPCATASPTFQPVGGTYAVPQTVTIHSTTAGAVIHFTTDGTDPTHTSPEYTQPVEVAQSLALRAIAFAPNYGSSAIATAIYTIDPASQAAAPTIAPHGGVFCEPVVVTLETSEPNGVIHYTTDGSAPDTSSAVYSTPFTVTSTVAVRAVTAAPGKTLSTITVAAFTINIGCHQVEPVVISPGSQTAFNDVSVTLSTATVGSTICFTLDGSNPTCQASGTCQSGQTYAGIPLVVGQTGTVLTARACQSGIEPSATSNATYTLEVGPVSFQPIPGNVTSGTPVSFGTVTSGAIFRYRTDGVDPTCTTGEVFDPSGPPLSLTQDTTFRVIACRPGYGSSAVAVGSYVIVPG